MVVHDEGAEPEVRGQPRIHRRARRYGPDGIVDPDHSGVGKVSELGVGVVEANANARRARDLQNSSAAGHGSRATG